MPTHTVSVYYKVMLALAHCAAAHSEPDDGRDQQAPVHCLSKGSLPLYASCTATLLLVGATFCLFAIHQIRIDQLEARIKDMQGIRAKINSVGKNAYGHAIDVLHRYAREALSGKVDSKESTDMDKLVEEMINLQVTKTTIYLDIYIYIYIYIYI